MASAEIIRPAVPPPPPFEVKLTLSPNEARVLFDLFGAISGGHGVRLQIQESQLRYPGEIRAVTDAIHRLLDRIPDTH